MATTPPAIDMPVSAARTYRAPRIDKPWGHEIVFAAAEGKYAGKVITVRAGHSLSLQFHREKEETISVLAGTARVEHGPEAELLVVEEFGPGDTIHLTPGTVHRITAIDEVTFVECSTAAAGWREDVVRLEDRYGRQGTCAP